MANYDKVMEDHRTPLNILIDLQEAVAKDANNATIGNDTRSIAESIPLSIMAFALEELVWRRTYEQCNSASMERVEFYIEKCRRNFDGYLLALTGKPKARRARRRPGTDGGKEV